jgi:hypothetical protein
LQFNCIVDKLNSEKREVVLRIRDRRKGRSETREKGDWRPETGGRRKRETGGRKMSTRSYFLSDV